MKVVSRLLSINQMVINPYHPMCDGLVERFSGTLKAMLKRIVCGESKGLGQVSPSILFAYREVPQKSLGFASFELL